jgi:3-methylcrotonyl-CoA carboxylase alpha subunit
MLRSTAANRGASHVFQRCRAVRRLPPAAHRSWEVSPRSFSTSLRVSWTPPRDDWKVLIANRGEIACRVIRTCQRLGIPTVAIYSSADGPDCLHARMADESYQIGTGPTPRESYLQPDDILRVALDTGVHAIHPGYGFLSENAAFAELVTNHRMTLVGPPPSAMTAMASKSRSKAIMEAAGVPTTPGYFDQLGLPEHQTVEFLLSQAVRIGFPVLIKAVMGGGGKGMRLVGQESEFDDALRACQREAQSAFGNADVLLEKYLVRPRHVEVQIVADSHGNVVHLFERDCSLQRRHQKIIEEAPASDLPPDLRARLGENGCQAARAVGYVNAGTVEFLLDTTTPGDFFFCEMNTRLQVEHPITEQITGVDLVEWQLRIAAGEVLPKTQDELYARGHAFEARVYAEHPARGFLPATGTVWHHQPPAPVNQGSCKESGIRVDTGLQAGQQVGVYYDPMISKLIVHDTDRTAALQKLVRALKGYQIAGVPTNIDFLIKCATHPTFGKAGAVNTGFLEDFADDVRMEEDMVPPPLAQAVGAFASMLLLEKRVGIIDRKSSVMPWSTRHGSWRMGGSSGRAKRVLEMEHTGFAIECLCNQDGSFDVQVCREDGTLSDHFHIKGSLDYNSNMEVVVNNSRRIKLTTILHEENGLIRVRMWPYHHENYHWKLDVKHPLKQVFDETVKAGTGEGSVKAPMPGRITRVNFAVGDTVATGDVILVMEAMKMEHAIKAPQNGVLTTLNFEVDDVVEDGSVVMIVESISQVREHQATS